MASVNDNINPSEHLATKQPTSVDPKERINVTSNASKTRMVRNMTGDRSAAQMFVYKLYVFFF